MVSVSPKHSLFVCLHGWRIYSPNVKFSDDDPFRYRFGGSEAENRSSLPLAELLIRVPFTRRIVGAVGISTSALHRKLIHVQLKDFGFGASQL